MAVREWVESLIQVVYDATMRQSIAIESAARRVRGQLGREGQGMVEYALILAFIAILVLVALRFLQPGVNRTLNTVANSL